MTDSVDLTSEVLATTADPHHPPRPGAAVAGSASETPAWRHETGPRHTPTSALALGPVVSPPYTVDGFVKAFLHELNFGQGFPLSTASVNGQYLSLARTVRSYLTARGL